MAIWLSLVTVALSARVQILLLLFTFIKNFIFIKNFPNFTITKFYICCTIFKVCLTILDYYALTISWRRLLSYRNQSIDLPSKAMDWFLYDIGLCHERVKRCGNLRKYNVYKSFSFWGAKCIFFRWTVCVSTKHKKCLIGSFLWIWMLVLISNVVYSNLITVTSNIFM